MIARATSIKLSDTEFIRLSKFIYRECGINLTVSKKALLENRLQKRVYALGFQSFDAYYDYIMTPKGKTEELVLMIDAVATNKTDFFREPAHFEFLTKEVVPAWRAQGYERPFKVWSAACSTGEEPYTIAMVLNDLCALQNFNYRITATDISTKALDKAIQAIYPPFRCPCGKIIYCAACGPTFQRYGYARRFAQKLPSGA
jgi:chemotaxis protein methyltransferase CheR